MFGHTYKTGVESTLRDRVYGVELFRLWLNLIEGFIKHHAIIGCPMLGLPSTQLAVLAGHNYKLGHQFMTLPLGQ